MLRAAGAPAKRAGTPNREANAQCHRCGKKGHYANNCNSTHPTPERFQELCEIEKRCKQLNPNNGMASTAVNLAPAMLDYGFLVTDASEAGHEPSCQCEQCHVGDGGPSESESEMSEYECGSEPEREGAHTFAVSAIGVPHTNSHLGEDDCEAYINGRENW